MNLNFLKNNTILYAILLGGLVYLKMNEGKKNFMCWCVLALAIVGLLVVGGTGNTIEGFASYAGFYDAVQAANGAAIYNVTARSWDVKAREDISNLTITTDLSGTLGDMSEITSLK